MEIWPTNVLPEARLDFTSKNESAVIRTQMASGRIRQRRRFTSDMKTQAVMWRFTDDEFAVFQSFVFYKLNAGTDYFYTNLRIGDGLKQYRVRFVNGEYTGKLNERMWDVTANLEIEEQQYLPEEYLDLIAETGDIEQIEAAAGASNIFWNVTLPSYPAYQP